MALVIAADRGSRWKALGEPGGRQIALQEARRGERSGSEQDHVRPMGQAIFADHADNAFWRALVAEQSEHRLAGDDGYIRLVANAVEEASLGVGLQAHHRSEAVEAHRFPRIVENARREAERHWRTAPVRRSPLEARHDSLRIGLDVEAAHVEQRFRLIVIWREFVIAERPAADLKRRLLHELAR